MNKQFEEWYNTNDKHFKSQVGKNLPVNFRSFKMLPFSMQWGVYLEFFDSVGIRFTLWYQVHTDTYCCNVFDINKKVRHSLDVDRPLKEKQCESIKKAFELL